MKEKSDSLSVPYNLPVASTLNVHKPQNAYGYIAAQN